MPFTFAHIGYVLPIKKRWTEKFSFSGLLFGSLAPDYDILFRFTNNRIHIFDFDFACVFLMVLPLAFFSLVGFHLICQRIILQMIPKNLSEHWKSFLTINIASYVKENFIKIILSLIFAIYLHLILDFICHVLDAHTVYLMIFTLTDSAFISQIFYYLAIYFIPILLSMYGFYLLYKYAAPDYKIISNYSLTKRQFQFWLLVSITMCLFTIAKYLLTQREEDFTIDFIIITITSAFIFSIFFCCLIYQFILTKDA